MRWFRGLLIAVLISLVPSAVRNKMLRRCTAKFTGKISGWPSTLVTRRPRVTSARWFQHSVSDMMETG